MFVNVAENNVEDISISPVVITAPIPETPAAMRLRIHPASDYAEAVRNDPPPPPPSNG